jgi:uncharacterized protein YbaP (TraB family)
MVSSGAALRGLALALTLALSACASSQRLHPFHKPNAYEAPPADETKTKHKPHKGPPVYEIDQGGGKVFIFGGGIPFNGRWLTQDVESALILSGDMWQENPITPSDASDDAEWDRLGKRTSGTLFDDLSAEEARRVMQVATPLGLTREDLAPYYSWSVVRILTSRYWPKALAGAKFDDVGGLLRQIAVTQSIPIHSEYGSWKDLPRFFAGLPRKVQTDWLLYQLDIMQQPVNTVMAAGDAWADGKDEGLLSEQDQLRTRYPPLYEAIEINRNEQWAIRIEKMLQTGGTHFVYVGVQHTIGPESIQVHATRHGLRVRRIT